MRWPALGHRLVLDRLDRRQRENDERELGLLRGRLVHAGPQLGDHVLRDDIALLNVDPMRERYAGDVRQRWPRTGGEQRQQAAKQGDIPSNHWVICVLNVVVAATPGRPMR